jgi:hypothetical protein
MKVTLICPSITKEERYGMGMEEFAVAGRKYMGRTAADR